MQVYHTKKIISGNLTEFIVHNEGVTIGKETNNCLGRKGQSNLATHDEDLLILKEMKSYLNRKDTINSNKSKLRRLMLANSNQYQERDKFITLTFKKNIKDISISDNEFIKFLKRLKRYCNANFKYLAVREKQNRGAIHYHCIFYDLPFIPQKNLLDLWNKNNDFMGKKKSGVNIKSIEEGEAIISSYMSKYFVKQLDEDDFLKERKIILKSRDLIQPIEEKLEEKLVLNDYSNVDFACSFIDTRTTYIKMKKN